MIKQNNQIVAKSEQEIPRSTRNNNSPHPVIPSAAEGSCDIYPLPHQTPRRCSGLQAHGFTLVELAIALMVIGLLIGGVLKGQELIENARIIRTTKDLNDFDTAIMIFRSIYNDELPGQLSNPGSRLPDCHSPCNSESGGVIRSANFWRHLDRAGLISPIQPEPPTIVFSFISPINSFGGHYVFVDGVSAMDPEEATNEHPAMNLLYVRDNSNNGLFDHYIKNCTRLLQMDKKMDDGKPLTGDIKLYVNHRQSQQCYDIATLEYTNNQSASTYFMVALPSMN